MFAAVPDAIAMPSMPMDSSMEAMGGALAVDDKRITVWNRVTKRKIAGKAAPMSRNLENYLRKNPDCEVYTGQDAHVTPEEKKAIIAAQNRIAIWNKATRKRISGNAAPREAKLAEYLRKHPECEVYNGQDKEGGRWSEPVSVGPSTGTSKPSSTEIPAPSPSVPVPSRANPISVPAAVPMAVPQVGGGTQNGIFGSLDGLGKDGIPALGDFDAHEPVPMPEDDMLCVGSLGNMTARSLENMLMGMSLDEMGGLKDFSPSGAASLNADYTNMFGSTPQESLQQGLSPAQRIKRDRAISITRPASGSVGSLAGSALAHPAQRMRHGPGPGSLPPQKFSPDLTDLWSASPGELGNLGMGPPL